MLSMQAMEKSAVQGVGGVSLWYSGTNVTCQLLVQLPSQSLCQYSSSFTRYTSKYRTRFVFKLH